MTRRELACGIAGPHAGHGWLLDGDSANPEYVTCKGIENTMHVDPVPTAISPDYASEFELVAHTTAASKVWTTAGDHGRHNIVGHALRQGLLVGDTFDAVLDPDPKNPRFISVLPMRHEEEGGFSFVKKDSAEARSIVKTSESRGAYELISHGEEAQRLWGQMQEGQRQIIIDEAIMLGFQRSQVFQVKARNPEAPHMHFVVYLQREAVDGFSYERPSGELYRVLSEKVSGISMIDTEAQPRIIETDTHEGQWRGVTSVITAEQIAAVQHREITDVDYIVNMLLPELGKKMRADGEEYGFTNHQVLGPRGQFADIWRKIGKLRRALWDGQTLKREQPREVLLDLIGHCLLTITMIDSEAPEAEIGG